MRVVGGFIVQRSLQIHNVIETITSVIISGSQVAERDGNAFRGEGVRYGETERSKNEGKSGRF